MSVPPSLDRLVGNWHGINRLWLAPGEPVRISETTASVALIAEGKFLAFRYTWADEEQPQEGFFLFGQAGTENVIKAVWIDSWHMRDETMLCQGSLDPRGRLSVAGLLRRAAWTGLGLAHCPRAWRGRFILHDHDEHPP